jgi:predicted nucleic acid-binding protein
VLADTPVWSAAFQRPDGRADALRVEMVSLIGSGSAVMIGPIRQELLSGISDSGKFERVRNGLRPFPDLPIVTEDYETGAGFYNLCRRKGIQGSMTDFLICAVAMRTKLRIFTTDRDFWHFQRFLPLALHEFE